MAWQGPAGRDPKSRANLLSQDGRPKVVETSRTSELDNMGVVNLQREMMKEQDLDLAALEAAVLSTKHIALTVNEELDLHTRLLDDLDQDTSATNSRLQMVQKKLGLVKERARKSFSMMQMCVLVVVIVFLVLLAFKLLL